MRKFRAYTSILLFFLSCSAFAQVQIDHEVQLTGSGTDARINGIKSVIDSLDATSVKSIQQGRLIYAMSSGSSNTFVVNLTPPISGYDTGLVINFISNQSVSGPATLSVNNLAAIPITKYINQSLAGCEIQTGQAVTVLYDGTNFQMISVIHPGAPAGIPITIAGSGASPTQITANWDSAAYATGYYLDVATDIGFVNMLPGYNNLNVGDVFTYNVTGLSCGITYYYRVRSSNNCTTSSSNSNIDSLSTSSCCACPTLSGLHYLYKTPVTINSGSALTNYDVNVLLNTATPIAAGKMNANGSDIRFTDADGCTLLSYWIESGINTSSTSIWVNVPSVPMGTKTIYVYYGNSNATAASNGTSTFLFFDDFSNGLGKWTTVGSPSISGGELVVKAGDQTISTTSIPYNVIVETRLGDNITTVNNARGVISGASTLSGTSFFTEDAPVNSNFAVWAIGMNGLATIAGVNSNGSSVNYGPEFGAFSSVSQGDLMGMAIMSGGVNWYRNFVSQGSSTSDLPSGTLYPLFNNQGSAPPFDIVNIRVRNFTSPEPTTSVGSEGLACN